MAKITNSDSVKIISQIIVTSFSILLIIGFSELDFYEKIIENRSIIELSTIILFFISFLVFPFTFFPNRSRVDKTIFMSNFIFIIVFGSLFIISIFWMHKNSTSGIILLSSIMATVGWTVTQRNSRKSAQKQHTITILLQMRNSDLMQFHIMNISNRVLPGGVIDKELLATIRMEHRDWSPKDGDPSCKKDFPVYSSILWMSNYYEFIAHGILSGDLDWRMMESTIRGQFCDFYCRNFEMIKESQNRDPQNKPTNKKFSNFSDLFEIWANELEKKRVAL